MEKETVKMPDGSERELPEIQVHFNTQVNFVVVLDGCPIDVVKAVRILMLFRMYQTEVIANLKEQIQRLEASHG